jgi:tetrahydromethanopterin S-methyltransferase subunit G
VQTQQEAEQTIELSLRERGINLVRSRKTELKTSTNNKIIPRSVLTTLTIEEEYAKVLNWLGDIERRLPTARMKVVQITGGSTGRQLKMDVSFETPIFNLAAADAEKPKAK